MVKRKKVCWIVLTVVGILLVTVGVFRIIKINQKYPQRVIYTYDKDNPLIENSTYYKFGEVRVLSPERFEQEFCKKEIWTLYREYDDEGNEIAGSYMEGYYIIIPVTMESLEDRTIFTMEKVVQFHLETENCDKNPTYDSISKNVDTGILQNKGKTQDTLLVFFVDRSSVRKKGYKNISEGQAEYDLVYCDDEKKLVIHLGKGKVEE